MSGQGKGHGSRAGEQVLSGLGVSPGIAVGQAHVVEPGMVSVPEYEIAADAVDAECRRLHAAVEEARRELEALRDRATRRGALAGEELDYVLEAGLRMLSGSRLLRGAETRIREERRNAEAAVQTELRRVVDGFAAIADPYLAARAHDVRDVGLRLLRCLTHAPSATLDRVPDGSVLIADELSPADAAALEPGVVAGFATAGGGAEGHTAIMARSLGLPAVMGVRGLVRKVAPGDLVVIDGSAGQVILAPTPATLRRLDARREALRREERTLARLRHLPAQTRDGVTVRLEANIELPQEVDAVRRVGADGIGLLRSEFMFMNRDDLPDEEEQYRALAGIVEAMEGRPVTVRTLDIGGEKLATAIADGLDDGSNPAMGLRAIRLSLKLPALLDTQLAAVLRAGAHGPVRLLLPMVNSPAEIRQVRSALQRVARRLRRRGQAIADPLPPLGVMIETPAAALAADSLTFAADFFSIGTNDLTMYTLAIDRSNEQVAPLYDPLHPAVLRLIRAAVDAALGARIPVNLCGEMAGEPRYAVLLLGLGLRELSLAPLGLARVKRRIRALSLEEARRRAHDIMQQIDAGRIAALIDDFNEALG